MKYLQISSRRPAKRWLMLVGGVHKGTPIAGWFLQRKIPNITWEYMGNPKTKWFHNGLSWVPPF